MFDFCQVLITVGILSAVGNILYGSAWIYYLNQLTAKETAKETPKETTEATSTLCRDVQPALRTALLVFACLQVAGVVVLIAKFIIMHCLMARTRALLRGGILRWLLLFVYAIFAGVYVYQIQYLFAVNSSTARTDHCSEIETRRRKVVYAFGMLVLVAGGIALALHMCGIPPILSLMLLLHRSSNGSLK
jgi:hypothetical protein